MGIKVERRDGRRIKLDGHEGWKWEERRDDFKMRIDDGEGK